MTEPTDFWRDIQNFVDARIQVALEKPTGIRPGVYSGITFDKFGRATFAGASFGLLALYAGTASGTVPYDASGTEIVWNYAVKQFDPGTLVTVGTAWKFTAPSTGIYMVHASLQTGGAGGFVSTDNFYSFVKRGGTANWGQLDNRLFEADSTVDCYLHGLTAGSLTAGEYIQPYVGLTRNVSTSNILVSSDSSATKNKIAIFRVG